MSELSAVFLDRDGTIIEDTHYPRDPDKVIVLPNALEGMKRLNEKGFSIFVISNQSGVGRGIITQAQFKAVHKRVCEHLQGAGIEVAEFFYCFHKPEDECNCRKPRPGLVPKTFQGKAFNFSKCYMVGDRDADLLLAQAIGANGFLVLTGKGQLTLNDMKGSSVKYRVCKDLLDFAEQI